MRMCIWQRTVCVVNCHLAAHTDGVARRNEDWLRIYQGLAFGRMMGTVGTAVTSTVRAAGGERGGGGEVSTAMWSCRCSGNRRMGEGGKERQWERERKRARKRDKKGAREREREK